MKVFPMGEIYFHRHSMDRFYVRRVPYVPPQLRNSAVHHRLALGTGPEGIMACKIVKKRAPFHMIQSSLQ